MVDKNNRVKKVLLSVKKKIKMELAEGFLVVEKYNMDIPEERDVVDFRIKRCMGDLANGIPKCIWYDELRDECIDCGCVIELKTLTITERNPERGTFRELMDGGTLQKSHCPHGRWMDKVTANFYRELDGRKLID